ncbi:MAG: DinB family protein [Ignavibacteriales bacterium]|nr:DinB family protein [Ignavibacteriales bacterium]
MSAAQTFISIFKINSALFVNVFKDVDDETASKRPNEKTNSMIFLALHSADARYYILNLLGSKAKNPYAEEYKDVRMIEDVKKYPLLEELLKEWKKTDRLLTKKLGELKPKQLKSKTDFKFSFADKTLHGALSFLAAHESYHIGQLGLIRKYHGLQSVNF